MRIEAQTFASPSNIKTIWRIVQIHILKVIPKGLLKL